MLVISLMNVSANRAAASSAAWREEGCGSEQTVETDDAYQFILIMTDEIGEELNGIRRRLSV